MMSKKLVIYFSAERGTTKRVAEMIAKEAGADIYAIEPLVPYTEDDLYWPNEQCRSVQEMKVPGVRPEIKGNCDKLADADVVFLGFPIWCGVAPTIVNTFLEANDFSGKTIVPFATSGGSGYGRSNASIIPSLSDDTKVLPGTMMNRATEQKVAKWLESLDI
ncbi:MAG: flavodoxin [Coriobacteriales bacterium]|jgi:flavodoxin